MKLIVSLLITLGVEALAGYITAGESSGEWFMQLNKPWFQPPNWLFAPVWTMLYILMGISIWLIWKQPASIKRNRLIGLFAIHLLLNFMWSIIFFKWHRPGIAFIDIITLWLMIFVIIFSFSQLSKVAAWLLVPYIVWVSFAMILNWSIYDLN